LFGWRDKFWEEILRFSSTEKIRGFLGKSSREPPFLSLHPLPRLGERERVRG
jgi:hypothetical protein